MPTTPDCRIRFPAVPLNFNTSVGITGQEHDTYPAAGQQPRWDWMRLYLIGLLSQQASYSEPTQFREGTPWFDLNEGVVKIRRNDAWVHLAEALQLGLAVDGSPVMLSDVYATIKTLLGNRPTATFSGHSTSDGVTVLPIPSGLRSAAGPGSRPFVWINGVQVDPRNCEYAGGTSPVSILLLDGVTISKGDRFTAIMMSVDPNLFSVDEVVV